MSIIDKMTSIFMEAAEALASPSSAIMVDDKNILKMIYGDMDFPVNYGNPFIGVEDTSGAFRSPHFDGK